MCEPLSPYQTVERLAALTAENAALKAFVEALTEDGERLVEAVECWDEEVYAGVRFPLGRDLAARAVAAHRALMEGT